MKSQNKNTLRLAFVNPYIPSLSWFFYAQGMSTPPLGMMTVAAHLNRECSEMIVIDGQQDYESPKLTLKKVLDFFPEIVVLMAAPVLHLYTFMANTAFPYHLAFLRALKKRLPGVKTILGGLIPRQIPGTLLSKETALDIIILESHPLMVANSVSAILKGTESSKIPGIAFRDKDGTPKINKKTSSVSNRSDVAPDLTLQNEYNVSGYGIDKNLYLGEKRDIYPVYPVISMLGCPFNCSFCATPLHFPVSVKAQNPQQFSSYIENTVNIYNVTSFSFWDDTFTRNPAWVTSICNSIINLRVDIQWWCFGKVEWVLKNRSLLPLLRRAGCTMMWLGIESVDETDLAAYKKGIRFPMAREAVDALCSEGILPTTSFILGNVNCTEEKILRIVTQSSELEAKGAVNIYTLLVPVPGTQLYRGLQKAKLLNSTDLRLYNGTRTVLKYPRMSGDRLEEVFYSIYKNAILNERFLHNIGRTNFTIGESIACVDINKLRLEFEKEKTRMLTLEEDGYLDDEPQLIVDSCQWIFNE